MSRPKRQVPDPDRILMFLASGIVWAGLGLGRCFGVGVGADVGWRWSTRAIVELALFARGLGRELLFLLFLLPSPFGV